MSSSGTLFCNLPGSGAIKESLEIAKENSIISAVTRLRPSLNRRGLDRGHRRRCRGRGQLDHRRSLLAVSVHCCGRFSFSSLSLPLQTLLRHLTSVSTFRLSLSLCPFCLQLVSSSYKLGFLVFLSVLFVSCIVACFASLSVCWYVFVLVCRVSLFLYYIHCLIFLSVPFVFVCFCCLFVH